jgi:hypothetical protein
MRDNIVKSYLGDYVHNLLKNVLPAHRYLNQDPFQIFDT